MKRIDDARPARAAAAAVLALSVAACGSSATPVPSPRPTLSPAASASSPPQPTPALSLPAPDGSDAEQVLLRNADGAYDVYRGIGRLADAGSECTFVLLQTATGAAAATAPAFVLSNGHCVGLFDANTVIVDQPIEGGTATFDYFVDAAERPAIPVRRIAWATMKDVDLSLLELDATLGDLAARGYRPWPIGDPPAPDTPLAIVGAPVGVPIVNIPDDERYLRIGTCPSGALGLTVNERQWRWSGMTANACPEILPGNSGSPMLDRVTGTLVGLINTTTHGSEGSEDCWLGRPCEVGPAGEVARADTNYAVPVAALSACFDSSGRFTLGGSCTLDPGGGVELAGAPLAVNPSAPDPLTGEPRQTTWATEVSSPAGAALTHYRYKIGPLGTTSCADDSGYGDVLTIAETPTINDPLPTPGQRLLLCVVGGPGPEPDGAWQAPANASIAVAYIDTTAPTQPVEFSVGGDRSTGWSIEPIFDPPTYSLFLIKGGPATSTDCADRGGYLVYRRIPMAVEGSEAPFRFCAIGFDDANNEGPTGGQVLE